jgi:hypothetical protein
MLLFNRLIFNFELLKIQHLIRLYVYQKLFVNLLSNYSTK